MLYLPKKLDIWYSSKAQEQGKDKGEIMYFALRQFAESKGFECPHPVAEHILHEKVNKIYRCNLCGFLFYKKIAKGWAANGELREKVEIIPRIDSI